MNLIDRNFVLNLMSSSNCIHIPILLLKLDYSLIEALFLYALIEEWKFSTAVGLKDKEDQFPAKRKTIKEKYLIESEIQNKCTKTLIEKKVISIKKYGIPPKNYYKIDWKFLRAQLTVSAEEPVGDWELIRETSQILYKERTEQEEYKKTARGEW